MRVICHYQTDDDVRSLRRDSWLVGAICGLLAGVSLAALVVRFGWLP